MWCVSDIAQATDAGRHDHTNPLSRHTRYLSCVAMQTGKKPRTTGARLEEKLETRAERPPVRMNTSWLLHEVEEV